MADKPENPPAIPYDRRAILAMSLHRMAKDASALGLNKTAAVLSLEADELLDERTKPDGK